MVLKVKGSTRPVSEGAARPGDLLTCRRPGCATRPKRSSTRRGIQPVGMDDVRDALGGVPQAAVPALPVKGAVGGRRPSTPRCPVAAAAGRSRGAPRGPRDQDLGRVRLAESVVRRSRFHGGARGSTSTASWELCRPRLPSKPVCTKPSSEPTSTDSSARPASPRGDRLLLPFWSRGQLPQPGSSPTQRRRFTPRTAAWTLITIAKKQLAGTNPKTV